MIFAFPSRVRGVKNLPISCNLFKSLLFFSQPKYKGSQNPWAHSALIWFIRYWEDFVLTYTHRNQASDSAYPEVNKSSRTPSLADSLCRPSFPFLPDPSSRCSGMLPDVWKTVWHLQTSSTQHFTKIRSATCSDYLMGPWSLLRHAMFTKGLTSFFKVYKEKSKGFKKFCLSEHQSQTPLLTGASFCSCVKCYYYAQLKLLQTPGFFKVCQRNDKKLSFTKKNSMQILLPCRNCKPMNGSLDNISCLLIRNPNLPWEIFWVTSCWSFLKSSCPDPLACLFTPHHCPPYICPCWLLLS